MVRPRVSVVAVLAGLVSVVLAAGAGLAAPARADTSAPILLLDTVAGPNGISDWTVDPKFAPQIGQSFTLDHPVLAQQLILHPDEVSLALKPEYLAMSYNRTHFTYLHDHSGTGATTLVTIWKSNDGAPIPIVTQPKHGFDVSAGGFTNVYSHTYTVPVVVGEPFVLPIDPGVRLDPGNYLVAWFFTFDDKRIFGVRFWGEANGHGDGVWDGPDVWVPTVCVYKPIPDTSPPGTAVYMADQWATPKGATPSGPFPGTIGYLTWFYTYITKSPPSTGCKDPRYGGLNAQGIPIDKHGRPLKNPHEKKWVPAQTGDLDLQLMGQSL